MTRRGIDRPLAVLVALYLGGILSANATGAKLLDVWGWHVSTGALAIPLVYLSTDLINELYGPSSTRQVVWMGFVANVVLVIHTQLVLRLPASSLGCPQAAFHGVFHLTPRIVAGSLTAYLVSSLVDVWVFHRVRRATGGHHFWLRKNASTAVSQLLDSALFIGVAFVGVIPTAQLGGMVLGQYLVKMAAAPLGTPISYFVLRLVRSSSNAVELPGDACR